MKIHFFAPIFFVVLILSTLSFADFPPPEEPTENPTIQVDDTVTIVQIMPTHWEKPVTKKEGSVTGKIGGTGAGALAGRAILGATPAGWIIGGITGFCIGKAATDKTVNATETVNGYAIKLNTGDVIFTKQFFFAGDRVPASQIVREIIPGQ